MPKTQRKPAPQAAKSKRGRKPNIAANDWVHGYPIVILPMVSKAKQGEVIGYEIFALNLPSIGAVRIQSMNIQAAFSKINQQIRQYLEHCKLEGKKPTPPSLHGDLIPAPLADDLSRRTRLFAEIDAEALQSANLSQERVSPKRGERSRVQVLNGREMDWDWGTTAAKVADRFQETYPILGLADSEEVTRIRRKPEYRGLVLALHMDATAKKTPSLPKGRRKG